MNEEQSDFISALNTKYATAMVQLTYRRIGDSELAKELVQETFMIACCKPDTICKHLNPAGWLFNTLRKLTMREMKKAYHSEAILVGDIPDIFEDIELPLDSYIPQGLKDSERNLILMRVKDELTYAEISEIEGVSEVACRKQVSRAFKKCRVLLSTEKVNTKISSQR